ncbi:hypothetical protein BMR1_03g04865 [Babesia microti strain RI]|uniref:Nucleoside transporter n=1 Tax=Babesia microti (strain RI) TaxID=1133968 RepID=A0A0K3APH7_BABMR|nr:hypothetical protein BmR1_04g10005 [Babesia microti strain RI]XP_021337227.1 hypothetical protein BMR1_03g04865 [Babesia microti strain RI]CTQ40599.1 hypothetical protein BmR1_04g10005 [Babesia microti strain RI]CTQ41569.1 hypothetical protein BMR1_03g04865 [Babesia microti strain RI]|eukprot:XP_012649580.1 hypothetical protein BmR1_04g10005 [Babesia microti strain RI]
MEGKGGTLKGALTYPLFFFSSLALTLYIPICCIMPIRVAEHFCVDNFIDSTILSYSIANTTVSAIISFFGGMKYGHYIFCLSLGSNSLIFATFMIVIKFVEGNTGKYLYIILMSFSGAFHALGYTTSVPIALKMYSPNGSSFNFGLLSGFVSFAFIFEYIEKTFNFDDRDEALKILLIFHSVPIILSIIITPIVYYLITIKFIVPDTSTSGNGFFVAINGIKKAYPASLSACLSIGVEIFFIPAIIPYAIGVNIDDAICIIKYDSVSMLVSSLFAFILSSLSQQNTNDDGRTEYKHGVDSKLFYFVLCFLTLTRIALLIPALFFDEERDRSVLTNYIKCIVLYSGFVHGISVGLGFDGIFPLNVTGLIKDGTDNESYKSGVSSAVRAAELTAILFSCSITFASICTKLYFLINK